MALTAQDFRALFDLPGTDPRVRGAYSRVAFENPASAHEQLIQIAGDDAGKTHLASFARAFLVALSDTLRPDHVLLNLERLCQAVPSRVVLLKFLSEHPRAIEILVRLFIGSQFLTEIVLRNPQYVERLTQHQRLGELKSVEQFHIEAQGAMVGCKDSEARLDALRGFQKWELLRIGACDFFGLMDMRRVTTQLSLLADSLVQACLEVAAQETSAPVAGLAVIAMGKLGGEELNYSSDIDLVFVAAADAMSYGRVAQRMIRGLSQATGDGFLYRVDMRLRPWGNAGELVSAIDPHLEYIHKNAMNWEKQALLKARVIAGDAAVGRQFLKQVEPYLFTAAPDQVRISVRGMKQRIEADLLKKGRLHSEVKLGEGSIRDIEFVVQYLQLVHGGQHPHVRSFNTLDAIVRLADGGFLGADEYRLLSDGYVFLRSVEHSLQLMHNKQTHELPNDPLELGALARRLDFPGGDEFLRHYRRNGAAIRAVYDRYLGTEDKIRLPRTPVQNITGKPGVQRHLARLERAYSETFTETEIERHAAMAEQVSDAQPVLVDAQLVLPTHGPVDQGAPEEPGAWRVTIVGYDFPGELAHICGLMLVYGINILDGQVFTYEPMTGGGDRGNSEQGPRLRRGVRNRLKTQTSPQRPDLRRKIVDVFTVRRESGPANSEVWRQYTDELRSLANRVTQGHPDEAQGQLVKRVAAALRERSARDPGTLYPVRIRIDNDTSELYTLLHIETRDTIGFMYELANSLALQGIYISRVAVDSTDSNICDTLYVTDAQGRKISDPARQRELQAALVLIKHFTHLLPRSPNPEGALLHFREFVAQLFTRPDWMNDIASLERSEVMDALARLLGVSDFLWNDFLRMQHENLFPVVRDIDTLTTTRTIADLDTELNGRLQAAVNLEARLEELNSFKDREMFRVDMRHILAHTQFIDFSQELSDVAEVVVASACRLADEELRRQFGSPMREDLKTPALLSVCGLGKCGGRELGFASDIELMFLYDGEGRTVGGESSITSAEFFTRLVEGVTQAIIARREGIFQIDLRLRPYGRAGNLAVSREVFELYFASEGPAWPYERQALVKLRPIAGDAALGKQIVALRDKFVYTGKPFDSASMLAMRERQIRQLVTPGTFNAKLSPGGVVDVEYLVQGLQITHGGALPAIRKPNTLAALSELAAAGIVSREEAGRLTTAYLFLRRLIDALRIVRGNAKDLTVPTEGTEEFSFLARRLGYDDDVDRLHRELAEHRAYIQQTGQRLLSLA